MKRHHQNKQKEVVKNLLSHITPQDIEDDIELDSQRGLKHFKDWLTEKGLRNIRNTMESRYFLTGPSRTGRLLRWECRRHEEELTDEELKEVLRFVILLQTLKNS